MKIKKIVEWLLVSGVFLAMVILWRPFWHGFAMGFYLAPMLLIGLVFIVIGCILLRPKRKIVGSGFSKYSKLILDSGILGKIVGITIIVLGTTWLFMGMFSNTLMTAQLQHEIRQSVEQIKSLPNTSTDNFRMMPYQIAKNNARDTLTYSRYKLGNLDFVVSRDGQLLWNAALVPDGFWNTLGRKPMGSVYINATTSQFNVEVVESEFPYSDSIRFADNIK